MDPVALQILADGWRRDAETLHACVLLLRERLADPSPGKWSAAGYELNRGYNVLKKSFERLCETFENHFEKTGNYHDKLIERVTLEITGIRPALLPAEAIRPVRELKGFRHLFRHAYDLELDPDRLLKIADHAEFCAAGFPRWCETFLQKVGPLLDEPLRS